LASDPADAIEVDLRFSERAGCRTHHLVLHSRGDEAAWWVSAKVDPVAVADKLWEHTRLSQALSLKNDAVTHSDIAQSITDGANTPHHLDDPQI
jgi:hypothetical protein